MCARAQRTRQEDELRQSEQGQAEHSLAVTQTALKAEVKPATTIEPRIEIGDPAAVICMIARDLAVDVVVVGSHGKGFLSRVLLGSVSEHVARHAPCPVLVVREATDRATA